MEASDVVLCCTTRGQRVVGGVFSVTLKIEEPEKIHQKEIPDEETTVVTVSRDGTCVNIRD